MTHRSTPLLLAAILSLPALCAWTGEARAHPHVWITSVTTFLFEDRQLTGMRQRWRFDEFFSSYVIDEHDADGDGVLDEAEITAIRENAFSNLHEYGYFTHVRLDGEPLRMDRVLDFTASIEDEVLIYEFTLALPEPVDPTAVQFAAGVYDPEYYVEVLLDQHDPVRFAGLPNGACIFDIGEDTEHPIYYGMVYPLAIKLDCATS